MTPSPMSPYAISKLAGEQYCQTFFELYGFETVVLRYFNVFGPRQNPLSEYSAVIPRFIHRLLNGEHPVVTGDGLQTRDFTFVANVVQANLKACQAAGAAGQAVNIAAGNRISLLELLREIGQITGRAVAPDFVPARAGDVAHSYADIALAKEVLGYELEVGFLEGLELTVRSLSPGIV